MSDKDVYLSWKDPVSSNGILRFYYIRIYDTKSGQQLKNLVNKTAGKQNRPMGQLISNLKPVTNYTFTIQAVTIKPGEMANFTATTDEGGIPLNKCTFIRLCIDFQFCTLAKALEGLLNPNHWRCLSWRRSAVSRLVQCRS